MKKIQLSKISKANQQYLIYPLVITILLVCSPPAAAESKQSIGVTLYGVSYHLDRVSAKRRNFNEFNEGIGVHAVLFEDKKSFIYLEAGKFSDTFENDATYYAFGYRFRPIEYVSIGLNFMKYTSQSIGGTVYSPIPLLSLDYKIASVNFIYLPKLKNVSDYDSIGAYLTLRLIQFQL